MDNQSHLDNNICNICRINNTKEEFVSMVHKWREYGGYSNNLYPRYVCSTECLKIFYRWIERYLWKRSMGYRGLYCHTLEKH